MCKKNQNKNLLCTDGRLQIFVRILDMVLFDIIHFDEDFVFEIVWLIKAI